MHDWIAARNMYKPTFMIIGAQKSGTTTLDHYLRRHEYVYMSPIKELRFFSGESCNERKAAIDGPKICTKDEYYRFFYQAAGAKAIGEVSPSYLFYPGTAHAIREAIPEVKLIAILRNPLERAYSEYWHHWKMGRELLEDFRDFCLTEPVNEPPSVENYNDLIRRGLYAKQLRSYLEVFNSSQILILLYDDLVLNPELTYRTLCQFIEITFQGDAALRIHSNVGRVPKKTLRLLLLKRAEKTLHRMPLPERKKVALRMNWRRRLPSENGITRIDSEDQKLLTGYFLDDIRDLETIIGRDLSHWISGNRPLGR